MLVSDFLKVRENTLSLIEGCSVDRLDAQPVPEVSPPKWHLAHTTWFFESFVLKNHQGYREFDKSFHYLFNSYYKTLGGHLHREERGGISLSIYEILKYREHIDNAISESFISNELTELGVQHEEQHQELLLMDLKYISFIKGEKLRAIQYTDRSYQKSFCQGPAGLVDVGYQGDGFAFDNEKPSHKVFLRPYRISSSLITNEEYLAFIEDGGYRNPEFWLSDGWDWIQSNSIVSPLYWNRLEMLNLREPVSHISYYEADAFAKWSGKRLPTEFEWEAAARCKVICPGELWEWTASAYLPYPGYRVPHGPLGEYNAKFMCNQMVLRGGSYATPKGHSRLTYRNFYYPHHRWQFCGIRLAEDNL